MKKFYQGFISKGGIVFLMVLMFGVLSCGSANAQQLSQPEAGWTRYDDSNSYITYNGTIIYNAANSYFYGTPERLLSNSNEYISFKFYGTKFRIINSTYDNRSNSVIVKVDGINVGSFSQYAGLQYGVLGFEKTGLSLQEHTVVITSAAGGYFGVDALDIDSTGYLGDQSIILPSSISLSKASDFINVGQTDTLTATITPDNATNKTVTWTSSDSTVATVDATGKITAIKVGTATITATTQDGSNVSANCAITVIEPTNITLNKETDSINVGQIDTLIATTTPSGVNITWTSSDNTIATVDANGVVTGIAEGTVIITAATTTDGKTASCTVNVAANKVVLNIEPERNKIKKSETVIANLVIDNIQNIAAEDIRIKYDSSKLQFVNFVEVDGIKLVKNDVQTGELRFILASKGKDNIADVKKILLKLNFKGIAVGEALVDVVKGRVSDGIAMEKDLTDEQCGQATIIIEGMKDVNNSGEFTLLDLAIDARHLGENPTTFPQYNTDVVENGAIDDEDLLEIGNQMLLNPNYQF